MFDNLSDKLQRVFKNMRGEGRLTAENMDAALREVRIALLEADVNFKVVKQLIEAVKQRAMGQEVLQSLSPYQQVIGIISEELVKILGSHESKLRFANEPPSVFLIVGLQGSGKTTSTGKLARWLTKNGHRPQLVSVDIYRPAARKQLAIIARDNKLPIYEGAPEEKAVIEIARSARREAANNGRDVLLVDTAGRLHTSADLMRELVKVKRVTENRSKPPVKTLLVMDATTGQNGLNQAREFNSALTVDAIAITKLDGTAKGGIAVAVARELGIPIVRIGIGEGIEDLRPFVAEEFAAALVSS